MKTARTIAFDCRCSNTQAESIEVVNKAMLEAFKSGMGHQWRKIRDSFVYEFRKTNNAEEAFNIAMKEALTTAQALTEIPKDVI